MTIPPETEPVGVNVSWALRWVLLLAGAGLMFAHREISVPLGRSAMTLAGRSQDLQASFSECGTVCASGVIPSRLLAPDVPQATYGARDMFSVDGAGGSRARNTLRVASPLNVDCETYHPETPPAAGAERLPAPRSAVFSLEAGIMAARSSQGEPSPAFFYAIAQVETGNDPTRVGDNGRSRGAYQIRREYWAEACRTGGVFGQDGWDYGTGVWDVKKSRQVMKWYFARYGAQTAEEMARMHNGGPSYRQRCPTATAEYWARVKNLMADFDQFGKNTPTDSGSDMGREARRDATCGLEENSAM